jgi:hypothetical protein
MAQQQISQRHRDKPKHHVLPANLKPGRQWFFEEKLSPELFRGLLTEFKLIKPADRTMLAQSFEDPMGMDPPAVAGPQGHGINKTMPL